MTNDGSGCFIDRVTPEFSTLRAGKDFSKGELVLNLSTAKVLAARDYTSIDLGDSNVYHPVGRYINHCCAPTAYVDTERKGIVALSMIKPGDEITFNYLASERRIVAPFDCDCGRANCVGRIENGFAQPSDSPRPEGQQLIARPVWASTRKRMKLNVA